MISLRPARGHVGLKEEIYYTDTGLQRKQVKLPDTLYNSSDKLEPSVSPATCLHIDCKKDEKRTAKCPEKKARRLT
jgi:hypothetical protein